MYTANMIAVVNGGSFPEAFTLYASPATVGVSLSGLNGNLVTVLPAFSVAVSGSAYTIDITAGGAYDSVQEAVDYIRAAAAGNAVTIQFGNGTDVLDIGTASASFNNTGGTWGAVTLTGKITSANVNNQQGTITTATAVSLTSAAEIANTAAVTNANAFYHGGTGTVTISGGAISATAGVGVYNTTGSVTISGGVVSSTARHAVYNYAGAFTAGGAITISGEAVVTSANTANATIRNEGAGSITISGGTVSNTAAAGNAVYNNTGTVTLGGDPAISGRIYFNNAAASLNLSSFSPAPDKVYTLDFPTEGLTAGRVAVSGGALFIDHFELTQLTFVLEASGGNAVIAAAALPTRSYTITGGGTSFTATRDSATIADGTGAIQDVINAIRADAEGNNASIQFGDGVAELSIGANSVRFNNTGGTWGLITLTGKITSRVYGSAAGTVIAETDVSITSEADIFNRINDTGNAIVFSSAGVLTIAGGEVSMLTGTMTFSSAIRKTNGSAILNGGTVRATAAVALRNSGPMTISGGTIEATTGSAIEQGNFLLTVTGDAVVTATGSNPTINVASSTSGTPGLALIVSGGTVRNTGAGDAITCIDTSGSITISGGTIEATAGRAVSQSRADSFINLGGNPAITGDLYLNHATARVRVTGTPADTPAFEPESGRVYTLNFPDEGLTADRVAVTGGGGPINFATYFTLPDTVTTWRLGVSGNNLVIQTNP